MVDRQHLDGLRSKLYKVTPLRAEDLEPGALEANGWFVDVFAPAPGGSAVDDPIIDIVEQIAWSDRAVMVGLTGGTGVGKTTQLGRLARLLADEHGIACVTVDYSEFNELSSPPDVTDFLLSVVAGFASEALDAGLLPSSWDRPSVGARLLAILKRLQVPGLDVSVGPASVTVVELLRQDESFRARLREHLRSRVSDVIREVRGYAGEIAAAICAPGSGRAAVTLVVDSTEKLAAPGSAHDEMQAAVRNLFIQNGDNLGFPELHTVYLVPPWLPVSDGGALRIPLFQFPAVRVEQRGAQPRPDEHGLALLDRLVRTRMPEIDELLGAGELRALCLASGGVQRVLFQLLHGVARRARSVSRLPVTAELVTSVVDTLREEYLAVTHEAAPWLWRIQETNGLDGLPAAALATLDAYFQAMVVLQFANGTKWYAIHPLMRERVRRAQSDDG